MASRALVLLIYLQVAFHVTKDCGCSVVVSRLLTAYNDHNAAVPQEVNGSSPQPPTAYQLETHKREQIAYFTALEQKIMRNVNMLSVRVLKAIRAMEATIKDFEKSKLTIQNSTVNDTSVTLTCLDDFQSVGNGSSCYLLSRFEATWDEAKAYCFAYDSNLVAVESRKEYYAVSFLIKNNQGKLVMKYII